MSALGTRYGEIGHRLEEGMTLQEASDATGYTVNFCKRVQEWWALDDLTKDHLRAIREDERRTRQRERSSLVS